MLTVIASDGKVSVVERDLPSEPGTLIKVTSSGICGSDLHMIEHGLSFVILGHEFGGYTEDGRLVAIRPTGECGSCHQCISHQSQLCPDALRKSHGISRDGGLAEYVRVDENQIFEMPSGSSPDSVGLVEPLAVVLHGINRMNVQPGQRAVIVGAGSIGLLAASVLRDRGVDVDIVARHSHQFDAASTLGVHAVHNPGHNYDMSFDAVCTQQSFDTCIEATRPGGSLLEYGMFWTPLTLSNPMLLKEITVVPSIFYGHTNQHHDFKEAISLLHRAPHIADAVVTHRYSLAEAQQAFATASDRASGAIKVHIVTTM